MVRIMQSFPVNHDRNKIAVCEVKLLLPAEDIQRSDAII